MSGGQIVPSKFAHSTGMCGRTPGLPATKAAALSHWSGPADRASAPWGRCGARSRGCSSGGSVADRGRAFGRSAGSLTESSLASTSVVFGHQVVELQDAEPQAFPQGVGKLVVDEGFGRTGPPSRFIVSNNATASRATSTSVRTIRRRRPSDSPGSADEVAGHNAAGQPSRRK